MASLAAIVASVGLFAAASPALTVTPTTVRRGHGVTITGRAPGCPRGDTVYILSRAFVHRHEFAGVPAVLATVRRRSRFAATTTIPSRRRPGRYAVDARCGGGNLGITRHLTVTR